MPEWIAVVVLGIIEGITEFLPISSTGHLLIAERWLPRQSDLFNVVIQSGAVLAVLPVFSERVRQFVFCWRAPAVRDYLIKLLAAFALTGAGGVALEKGGFKLPEQTLPVAIALFLGGAAFLGIERGLKGRALTAEVSWAVAVAVGLGQLLAAIFPGVSRSGASIMVALLLGLNRRAATEFAFLVGIPTMLAAGGLKIFSALHQAGVDGPSERWGMVLLGFTVSALVSFGAVKWLLRYVQTHTFELFGWYRMGAALLVMLLAPR